MKEYDKNGDIIKQFDSYYKEGQIVVITTEYSSYWDDLVNCENYISVERAKGILKKLQEAIKEAES